MKLTVLGGDYSDEMFDSANEVKLLFYKPLGVNNWCNSLNRFNGIL